jgi:hypothetical protein
MGIGPVCYYVDTLSGAAFIPPEMLDFIDEHLGGVDSFVRHYNTNAESLAVLKNTRTALEVILEQRDFPKDGVFAELLKSVKNTIAKMEGTNEAHQ